MKELKQNLKVSISYNNLKLKNIPSFSFPPVLTCSNCTECKKKCYALRLARLRPRIATAWQNNLTIWQNNPQAVEVAILNASITSGFFRYFVGGDIPDLEFLKMMCKIAKRVKSCKFLAFTKNYNLVNDFLSAGGKIPKNLKIVFSVWASAIPNPFNLPTSNIIFKNQTFNDKKAVICGGDCSKCICQNIGCWNLKNGEKIYFMEH